MKPRICAALVLLLLLLSSGSASAETLVQNLLWSQPPDSVLDRQFARLHWDVDLFCQPYGGAITYVANGYSTTGKFAVFVDPCWSRVLYVEDNNAAIREHGSPGTGTNQYRMPQVAKAYSPNDAYFNPNYYNVFICDNGNNRIQFLRYYKAQPSNGLVHQRYYSSSYLPSPVDFDFDVRNDFSVESDDRLWVINANNTIVGVSIATGNILAVYGSTGSGIGQFDSLTAIACGHSPYDGTNSDVLFVVDAGNARIVRLKVNGTTVSWDFALPYYHATSIADLETDGYGYLWAIMGNGLVSKFTDSLVVLDEISMPGTGVGQLNQPTSVSIANGFLGGGGVMFSESWTDQTGIKGFTIGTHIRDLFVDPYVVGSVCNARVSMTLTDVTALRVRVLSSAGVLLRTLYDSYSGTDALVWAGPRTYNWNGRNSQNQLMPAGQYKVEVVAESNYRNPNTGLYSSLEVDTVEFTHCGSPCSWLVGDADGSGAHSISDAVYLINFIFAGEPEPKPHPVGSGDADCDGSVQISDNVYLINFIFAGGPPPACDCTAYR